MKKQLVLIMLMSMFAVAAVTSCDKTEDPANTETNGDNTGDDGGNNDGTSGGEGGTYTPPANLTKSEILQLIYDAIDATYNTNEFTETSISVRMEGTIKTKSISTTNRSAKKRLEIYYDIDLGSVETLTEFDYRENFTEYYYYEGIKTSGKLTDAHWNPISVYSDIDGFNWTITGNTIVGITTEDITSKYYSKLTITLNTSKKLHTLKEEYMDEDNLNHTVEVTYTYGSTNPAMPSGFAKEDFTPAEQFSLKVVWGAGLGENTFYSGGMLSNGLSLEKDIVCYAPKTTGKTPRFYSDAGFKNEVSDYLRLNDNNTILYVKWE